MDAGTSLWLIKALARILEKDLAAMNLSHYKATLQKTLKQKDLALWVCGGLVVANLILSAKVVNTEEQWVLIPYNNTDLRIPLTTSRYSDDYYITWASYVVNTLLCVNPESFEWKAKEILNITTKRHGVLKEKLTIEAEKIKKEQISTVFYPKEFNVKQSEKTIEVIGQHITYFGKKSTPVEVMKTFKLSWVVSGHGLILLKDFEEVKDD